MKIKRKEYNKLIRMRDMGIIIDSPAGELLHVTVGQLAMIHRYGGTDDVQINGPITLKVTMPE